MVPFGRNPKSALSEQRSSFATQGLHQEHEEPYPHRSEDREEDNGEPEGCLGDETGQFVHGFIAMDDYLAAKIHRLPEKGCDNSAIGVTILKVFGHVGVTIFKIVTPFSPLFAKKNVNLPPETKISLGL